MHWTERLVSHSGIVIRPSYEDKRDLAHFYSKLRGNTLKDAKREKGAVDRRQKMLALAIFAVEDWFRKERSVVGWSNAALSEAPDQLVNLRSILNGT